jgi:hypothetical protein
VPDERLVARALRPVQDALLGRYCEPARGHSLNESVFR